MIGVNGSVGDALAVIKRLRRDGVQWIEEQLDPGEPCREDTGWDEFHQGISDRERDRYLEAP
jgi:hypothetical protein